MGDGDYVSEAGSTGTIEIAAGDVASYLEFTRMLKAIDPGIHLPIDYVKSCPYLMSYLRGYQVKEKIESELLKRRDRRLFGHMDTVGRTAHTVEIEPILHISIPPFRNTISANCGICLYRVHIILLTYICSEKHLHNY